MLQKIKIIMLVILLIKLKASVLDEYDSTLLGSKLTPDHISIKKLSLIYNGIITRWDNGHKIVIIVMPMRFIEQTNVIINILNANYQKIIRMARKNKNIIISNNIYDALEKLKSTEGSIAILPKYSLVLINYSNKIHIIKIVNDEDTF